MPTINTGVWASAFKTFGFGSGDALDSFAWGFPTWLFDGGLERKIAEGEQVGYVEYEPFVPVGNEVPVSLPWLGQIPSIGPYSKRAQLPDLRDEPEFPEGSIFGPGQVWGPGTLDESIYDIPYEDTGPGEIPPADPLEQETNVAVDWGALLSGGIDILQGQAVGGGAVTPLNYVGTGGSIPAGGGSVPAKVTVDTRTGAVTPCRRRRRRRLLTSTDINDLAALKAIVGGGQAMNLAVAKAVRR